MTPRVSYLKISSLLLLGHAFFLPLFWFAHETNYGPGSVGVYSLFGIDHPPHNDILLTLASSVVAPFVILKYYRRGVRWAWYLLLLGYLALILPPTVGVAIWSGIGTSYYSGPFNHPAFGTIGPFYNEVSLLGVILPWVLFVPAILLGATAIFGKRTR